MQANPTNSSSELSQAGNLLGLFSKFFLMAKVLFQAFFRSKKTNLTKISVGLVNSTSFLYLIIFYIFNQIIHIRRYYPPVMDKSDRKFKSNGLSFWLETNPTNLYPTDCDQTRWIALQTRWNFLSGLYCYLLVILSKSDRFMTIPMDNPPGL